MGISVRRLAPNIGAEVTGFESAAVLRDLIHRYHVLLIRRREMTPSDMLTLTRCFGEPTPHPVRSRATLEGHPDILVLENGNGKRGARNDVWHSDMSFAECPPSITLLRAVEVPPSGGDTMWCNMVRAFDTLSDDERTALQNETALHSARLLQMRNAHEDDAPDITSIPEPTEHPVVRTHPHSGAQALYINPVFTMHFRSESWDASRPRIHRLVEHATRADNVYRHRWQRGDVMLWDNRTTMHFAHYDYDQNARRLMHRTTARGDRPS